MKPFAEATSWRAIAAAAVLTFGLSVPGQAQDDGFSLKITSFKQAIAETVGQDEGIAAFYRARDFEPLWTGASEADKARRLALIEAFSLAEAHGLPQGRYDAQALMARMAAARSGRDRGLLEVELTRTFIDFAHDLQSGVLEPNKAVSLIKRKAPRRPAAELLAQLATQEPAAVFRGLVPAGPEYTRLMQAKLRLEERLTQGGWGTAVPSGKLEPGDSGSAVVALRNRLEAMGYLSGSLSAEYDATIEAAVRAFQEDHGLEVDGVAGATTMREINITPEERLRSIMVAMERERWLNLPEGRGARHVLVNLVDYHAQIIDDDKVSFETRSVIGHQDADRQTPEFSDTMEHMVINPSWYVPRSIVVGEYLPLLRANPYSVSHLEITDAQGRVVNRGRGFSQFSARTFPFNMRQPPGPRNALGTVKFMFPNRYNIYLHDTPAKSLFSQNQRTFSHGCVRLNDPHDFAYALLARQEDNPEQYFQRILNSRQETKVNLDQPIPVHLIYRTAFTRAKGPVNFRPDVYGRDAAIWRALANEGVVLPTGRS